MRQRYYLVTLKGSLQRKLKVSSPVERCCKGKNGEECKRKVLESLELEQLLAILGIAAETGAARLTDVLTSIPADKLVCKDVEVVE